MRENARIGDDGAGDDDRNAAARAAARDRAALRPLYDWSARELDRPELPTWWSTAHRSTRVRRHERAQSAHGRAPSPNGGLTAAISDSTLRTFALRQARLTGPAPSLAREEEEGVTEIGVPDPVEPEIEVIPAVEPVPGPIELPAPLPTPERMPERVPA